MKIATWNVNSINARIDHFIKFIKKDQSDIILLQELNQFLNPHINRYYIMYSSISSINYNPVTIFKNRIYIPQTIKCKKILANTIAMTQDHLKSQ